MVNDMTWHVTWKNSVHYPTTILTVCIQPHATVKLLIPGDQYVKISSLKPIHRNLSFLCSLHLIYHSWYLCRQHATNHVAGVTLTLPSHAHIHTLTHKPGHGWLGGCSRCRGKSFAQGRGSDRSRNPYHSVHHCTAPGREGKRRVNTGKHQSEHKSQLKPLKFSVGRAWLESKSCMSNCHHRAFVEITPRSCTGMARGINAMMCNWGGGILKGWWWHHWWPLIIERWPLQAFLNAVQSGLLWHDAPLGPAAPEIQGLR